VPPESGISPIFANAWRKLAERAAMTMSHASATFAPAPAATPFTAHTTGFSRVRSVRTSGLYCVPMVWPRSGGGPPGVITRSLRSCPAQNARPAPVSRTARMSSRDFTVASASRRRWCISGLKLLSLSGRFSVTSA
jgi:hypothetical protein